MEQALNSLKAFPVLQGTSMDELAILACLLKPVTFADGAFVFHQGDVADYMLLIDRGSVEVLDEVSEATQMRLALRQEGDTIGEMALIDRHRRSSSIRALETVSGWALSHEDFHALRQEHPSLFILILMNVAREVSRRLHGMDKELSSSLFEARSGGRYLP